jgi:PAS domain S-box-containing protein
MAIEARRRDGPTGVDASALGEAVDRIASLPGLLDGVGHRDGGRLASVHGERYRALLQALGVAVYTTDADGRIDFYNDAAAAFWGRRPEIGELWCGSWRLYRPDGTPLPHDECPMAMALRDERPIRDHEAVAERPDGSRVAFVPYPTPLHDEDGRLVGAVNVLVDVTERKQAEDAVLAAAEALRASNAVKDEFLGLVSHELRTPVTTIFGNARLLRDRRDRLSDENQRSMVADIADDSERLLGVIENLLLLTRIDSGSEFELEPLVFSHVIHQSVDSFRRRHASRPVSIDSGQRHIIVEADRTYLELLMENLLSNAHKYSPPGKEVSVTVRLADGEAQVVVLDRGIGIDGSDPERLFTPFYRTDAAKRLTGGIGIGLAVCKRVLETQGGRIWGRARAGGGSEFGFALPLTPDAGEPTES